MKKLALWTAIALSLTVLLAGCGKKEEAVTPAPAPDRQVEQRQEKPDEIMPETSEIQEKPEKPEESTQPVEPEPVELPREPSLEERTRAVYSRVLTGLLDRSDFSDSGEYGFLPEEQAMEENKFLICDVDRDGREELILRFLAGEVEHHRGLVLAYDEEKDDVRIQLDEYPAMAFFENGSVLVHWAQNQEKCGAFWPYSIYVYRPEQDTYSYVGSVTAWDQTAQPEDYPSQVDVSRTGFVYYISGDGVLDEEKPLDALEYQAWLEPYIGSANQLDLHYFNLTEEAIGQLKTDHPGEQQAEKAPAP